MQIVLIMVCVIFFGLLVAASDYGHELEERIGLSWLFKLRGAIPASNDVVIISIDQASAQKLNLPLKPRKWPRDYHAQLVDKLIEHGANVIGFDMIFDEVRQPEHNQRFAKSIALANNVILFQYLQQQELFDEKTHKKLPVEKINLINPVNVLVEAAVGVSPFPLPKVPAQVNHAILYQSILDDLPTFPVTMLQVYARVGYNQVIDLIKIFHPFLANQLKQTIQRELNESRKKINIINTIGAFRDFFLKHPEVADKVITYLNDKKSGYSDFNKNNIIALINLYRISGSVYINFYGYAGSIKTIPYHEVLSSDPKKPFIDVKNKAVFIGFSEQFQPDQKDGFNTVFTNESSGVDISGVEIIATVFSNILEQQSLKVSNGLQDIFFIVVWGVLISFLLHFSPGLYKIPVIIILGVVYGMIVYYSFSIYYYWLPFIIPIFIQLTLVSILSFAMQYRKTKIERELIRQAFSYHLPVDIIDKIAKGFDCLSASGQKVEGVIMATDAQQYTQLSEKLSSNDLQILMNQYYEIIFKPIRAHNGIISDVVGDAAMAIWTIIVYECHKQQNSTHSVNVYQQSCLAALKIKSSMDDFNKKNQDKSLPTRIGLACGDFVIGHIGALDHFEYRAIGETVNTASRIEGVNKILNTHIIITEEVLKETENFVSRKLGCFILVGKKNGVVLYELISDEINKLSPCDIETYNVFNQGLAQFKAGEFQQALLLFAKIYWDGPSKFYIILCNKFMLNKPVNFNGDVVLEQK